MSAQEMIRVEGVSKFYGGGGGRQQVLKNISLTIPQGQFIAIVGTSGSGKTTLLNVMGGLDRTWEGEVHVAGQAMRRMSDREVSQLRNQHLGFVFQHFHLLEHMTCLENVTLPSFFGGSSGGAAEARAEEVLRKVGLGHKLHVRPSELSGGQKQRVAIARAMFNKPRVILCDEPTGSLDRDTGLQILELFQDLSVSEGLTMIVVTHEEHISRMASRIVRLEDGALASDTPNEPVKAR
jgi:putative ABC transport system ATP-binding protein